MNLEIRLLGPVELRVDGRPLAPAGPKSRALLGILALQAHRAVALEELIDGLWGERPPASAGKNLQLYVSQLRKLLADEGVPAMIATRGRSYELRVEPDAVDVLRFERLLAEAIQAQEAGSAGSAARAALALWRGPPLADVASEPFAALERRRLEELRLTALELTIEQDLVAGRHREAIAELDALLAQHPRRERLRGLRMLALYRSGRQAEALEDYREARRALVDELGIEPGRELRELQAAVLRQDPELDPGPLLSRRHRGRLFAGEATPLVGRVRELAMATEALADRGCTIFGAAGVGKSRMAAELARVAAGGASVEHVIATESARALPFGAFAHLLPADPAAAANPIPAVIAAVRERSAGSAAIVLVDDAHFLDAASAALVLALANTGTARLVLTARSDVPLPDAIVALWKDAGLLRLDLQPLAADEVAELVDAFLGGPADATLQRRAFELSEGNPLYVREFLADAEASGALARADGLWRLSGERPRLTRLRELIGVRTGGLSPPGRRALELLAIFSPLALAELRDLAGSAAIEELERRGLAVVGGGGEQTVALAHPLHGEVVRDELPAEAACRLRRELADALVARPNLTQLELVRAATWKLDAGEPDAELCLLASRSALLNVAGVPGAGWSGADPELALRLADAAGPGLEPALYAARALLVLDRFAEVEERLAPLEGAASEAGPELAAAYLRARALSLRWQGAGPQALELIERAARWEDGPDWSTLAASLRGWILFYDGRQASAVAELEPLTLQPGLAPAARLDLLVALVTALARLGLTDRCEALEPELAALAEELERAGIDTGWARYAVDGLVRGEAARDLSATVQRLVAAMERAAGRGDEGLAAGLGWTAGRAELIRGHALDAARLLEQAAGGLAVGDPRTALGLCLADLARAHAIRGDVVAAEAALARADAAAGDRPAFRRLALELVAARAWVEAARGRPAAGREKLLALAQTTGEDLAMQLEATHGALRLGAPPRACAEGLAVLAERMQSELACACAGHARALVLGDGRAQLEAAQRFAELETDLLCAEAAAGAARVLREEGTEALAQEAAVLAATHAARCQGARTPALAQAEDLLALA